MAAEDEHYKHFFGQIWHCPSTRLVPSAHYMQIDAFDAKNVLQIPCLHAKHFPFESASLEKGDIQFMHLVEFEGSQVKQGEAHKIQVFEEVSLNGGTH